MSKYTKYTVSIFMAMVKIVVLRHEINLKEKTAGER